MQCVSDKLTKRNLLITISYDGSAFHGWQIQQNAITVQEVFQNALYSVVGDRPDIKACSRTDTGVHARMFCISTEISHPITCERLVCALNSFLPDTVAVSSVCEVPLGFHARYDCVGKQYIYQILNSSTRDPFLTRRALYYRRHIDAEMLCSAAQAFVGSHDFTSFCTLDKRDKGDFVRNVTEFSVCRDGDMVYMTVSANGFLYNMVRIMTGTLLYINEGKLDFSCIGEVIAAKNRELAGPTAPAHGLYLNKVCYDLPQICDK